MRRAVVPKSKLEVPPTLGLPSAFNRGIEDEPCQKAAAGAIARPTSGDLTR
jgi:hypothetical protein